MLLYEIFAIGIAVVLVVAAIGGLAARGPEETALLRLARAVPAQRRLVASAAQQKRDARAATAQRRLVASAVQLDDWIRRCLKRQYEDALAAPLSPRLATLITQLETQTVSDFAQLFVLRRRQHGSKFVRWHTVKPGTEYLKLM